MPSTRRFFFFGNAAAMSGRLYRPRAFDLDIGCASSLTPAGGVSSAKVRGATHTKRHDGLIAFASASTHAEGRFADEEAATEMTWHRVAEDALRTSTVVRSHVSGLELNLARRVRAKGLVAQLTSTSPDGPGEAPITIGRETEFSGLALDDFGLKVEIDHDLFNRHATRASLVEACSHEGFRREHATSLLAAEALDTAPPDPKAERPTDARPGADGGPLYCSIVKGIRWRDGKGPEWATIVGHTIRVTDVGTLFFGEILISHGMRRLTMLRCELGSPVGGRVAFAAVEKNGSWVP